MKKILSISIIFFLTALNINAQVEIKCTYFDSLNTHTKEIYEILESDKIIYNGNYWLYSIEGNMLEKGHYSNNSKDGEWVRINNDGDILYSGNYNNNEFTGFQFSYDDNGVATSDYYQNSISIEKDSIFILEAIALIRDKLSNSRFSKDERKKDDFESFMGNSHANDSISTNYILTNFDNLALTGITYYTEYFLFEESIIKLELLNSEIEKYKLQNSDNPLLSKFDPIYDEINNRFTKTANIRETINRTIILEDKFRITTNIINDITSIVILLNKEIPELNSNTKEELTDLYQSRLKKFNNNYKRFNNEKDLGEKHSLGKKLQTDIALFNSDLSELSTILSEIRSLENNLEENYKSKYPLVYNDLDIQIKKNRAKLKKEENHQKKIKISNKIKNEIISYSSSLQSLDSIQIFINERYETLKNTYLQLYPSIYSKEIKNLSTTITNYKKLESVSEKISVGKEISNSLKFYDDALSQFEETERFINSKFNLIEISYKEKYREIYKSEVIIFKKVFKRYKLLSGAISKIETGKQIRNKISELETNLELIDEQDSDIQAKFPTISQKYEDRFPNIYKSDIKIFEKKIDLFKKATTSEARLFKGIEILNDITNLELRFKEIQNQESEINRKLNQVEGDYEIDFPQIFRSEIKDEKANIKSYTNEGGLSKKITLGNIIIDRFDNLLESYPDLKQENLIITTELPMLIKNYKEYFPMLYKLHIADIIIVNKQYESSGYLVEKSSLSKKLVISIDELNKKYSKFKVQIDLISGLFDDFNLYYQNRKPVARILKRGNNTYKDLRKDYDNEINLDEKMKKGKLIELMLSKLISMANEDNSDLNTKMRSAKSVEDVLNLLGIK